MITITYDPINGVCVPDGKAKDYCSSIIGDYNYNKINELNILNTSISVGSEVIIAMFRLAITEGLIPPDDIVFKFNDKDASY